MRALLLFAVIPVLYCLALLLVDSHSGVPNNAVLGFALPFFALGVPLGVVLLLADGLSKKSRPQPEPMAPSSKKESFVGANNPSGDSSDPR